MNSPHTPNAWPRPRRATSLAALAFLATLATGCAGPAQRAPVEDRRPVATRSTPAPSAVPATAETPAPVKPALPGAENAGKPGYYTVKPGDTLIRVGLDNGQNWRDIARWSNLDNPNLIEVGQVLRIAPPGADPGTAAARAVAQAGRIDSKPLDPKAAAAAAAASAPASAAVAGAVPPTPASATPAREGDDDINWMWPAGGAVATPFDDAKSKGLAITGKAGDPVYAAADGRVVYAGAGLRGYGNLVIVKHNGTYLTAYAHNQSLLVKEEQVVRRGQKIAEMGSSDADRVQLHFEIRRQGKPVDPAKLLPPR